MFAGALCLLDPCICFLSPHTRDWLSCSCWRLSEWTDYFTPLPSLCLTLKSAAICSIHWTVSTNLCNLRQWTGIHFSLSRLNCSSAHFKSTFCPVKLTCSTSCLYYLCFPSGFYLAVVQLYSDPPSGCVEWLSHPHNILPWLYSLGGLLQH